ncbi:hypothetical protein AB1Y20_021275 [Prymnesium parvum]|uniref:Condensin complex subunit 2 n=1 Tax=Prymnesium parvum TaxID=97485 RepID=A0AB34JI86_PRYPA
MPPAKAPTPPRTGFAGPSTPAKQVTLVSPKQGSIATTAAVAAAQPAGGGPAVHSKAFSGQDTKDHFDGHGMTMADDSQEANPYDAVYSSAHVHKDTETHFAGQGMTMADDSQEPNPFDAAYSDVYAHKDTESHFTGFVLGASADPDEEKRAERTKEYEKAKKQMEEASPPTGHAVMGKEQLDSVDHFAGGSVVCAPNVDTSMGFDAVYDSRFVNKDTESHFDSQGMVLAEGADSGMTFDKVYDERHANKDTDSHFVRGTMLIASGDHESGIDPLRPAPIAHSIAELLPPPRQKFLHGMWGSMKKPLSEAMQAEMDQLVFAAPAASSVSATPPTSLKKGGRGLSSSNVANRSGRIGGDPAGGWDNSGRILSLPACQAKFAWAPDRIAHELVCKLDQFTHRREDHMRKLLWTIGTDPLFDPAATGDSSNRNSILITPQNFGRICSRFGLVCSEKDANTIFEHHRLPKEGCNMYTLTSKFLESSTETAALVRKSHKTVLIPTSERKHEERLRHCDPFKPPRAHEPIPDIPRRDPFKLARMPDKAWSEYRAGIGAGAGSSRDPLPPIATSSK